jgi:hypothetical protein
MKLDVNIQWINNDGNSYTIYYKVKEGDHGYCIEPIEDITTDCFIADNVKYQGYVYTDEVPATTEEIVSMIKEILKEEHNLTDGDFT